GPAPPTAATHRLLALPSRPGRAPGGTRTRNEAMSCADRTGGTVEPDAHPLAAHPLARRRLRPPHRPRHLVADGTCLTAPSAFGPAQVDVHADALESDPSAGSGRDHDGDGVHSTEPEMGRCRLARRVSGSDSDFAVTEQVPARTEHLDDRPDAPGGGGHRDLQPVSPCGGVPEQATRQRRLPLQAEDVEPTV